MFKTIRRSVAVGTVLTALVILLLGSDSLVAQTPTPSTTGQPASGEMTMDMTSPAADATPMDQLMVQMMEQCTAMMQMMMGMMGGSNMSGMMATDGSGMESMSGMATPTTTPSP